MRLSALLLTAALAACVAAEPPGPRTASPAALLPQGGTWQITRADGMDAPPSHVATLTLTRQGIGGDTGCNQYSGDARITATALDFSEIGQTERACADASAMAFERRVVAALTRADGVAGTPGGPLTLTAGGAEIARLVPLLVPPRMAN